MICLIIFIVPLFLESQSTPLESSVDYTGHRVIIAYPSNKNQYEFVKDLEDTYQLDLWNEPKVDGAPLMIRLHPDVIEEVEKKLRDVNIPFEVTISDLQSEIDSEKIENSPMHIRSKRDSSFEDLGIYRVLSEVHDFLQHIALSYSDIVTTISIGNTSENRPIMGVKIGSNNTNPVILIECGIHAREWITVASCLYTINELTSKYATDPTIRALVTNYQWYIIPSSNPDGYVYSWTRDRMWRKTRSRSRRSRYYYKRQPQCRGADANRNFDIKHCVLRSSGNPCSHTYCGDAPFSEKETQALRDLVLSLGNRTKAYFAIHSFSQLWLSPYGYKNEHPANHDDLMRVCEAGIDALRSINGTNFICGAIFSAIYPVSGTSVDWIYEKAGVKYSFVLELRDTGRYGFMLPRSYILPVSKETFAGLSAAVNALN